MSQEAAPEQALPEQPVPQSVPDQPGPGTPTGAPKGLLQQMEELMAALSADLSQLDADLQSSVDRLEPEAAPEPEASPEPEATLGRPADDEGREVREGHEDRDRGAVRGSHADRDSREGRAPGGYGEPRR